MILFYILVRSYNQPKLDSNATWDPDAVTFATNNTVGSHPYGIFINKNDTIYVANRQNGRIQIWMNDGISSSPRTISGPLKTPHSIFVTINNDIYVENMYSTYQIDKWTLDTNTSVVITLIDLNCYGLFVDISNTLYSSLDYKHIVVKTWLNNSAITLTTVAGTGTLGSTSNALCLPNGIFVDINFDLYVADYGNNRIQHFRYGQLSGTTVAGNSSIAPTITLFQPISVVLDHDQYLYIVDSGNHRIVGSGPNGFRCVVGCSGFGSQSDQLYYPRVLSFDSLGNIFVTDRDNHRIQKFLLMTNSTGKFETYLFLYLFYF